MTTLSLTQWSLIGLAFFRIVPLVYFFVTLFSEHGTFIVSFIVAFALSASFGALGLYDSAILLDPIKLSGAMICLVVASEFVQGLAFAFFSTLPWHAARWSGGFLDRLSRGNGQASNAAMSGPFHTLYGALSAIAFATAGGFGYFSQLCADWFCRVPVGRFSAFPTVHAIALSLTTATEFALLLCLPVAASILIAELGLSLWAKLSVRAELIQLTPQVRLAVAVAVALFAITFTISRLSDLSRILGLASP